MEQKIAIVTDTTCDLEVEYLKENNIKYLPLKIIYENEEYIDKENITPNEIYKRMEKGEIPKTSMPSIGEAKALIEKLKSEGYTHVLAVHISSGLSGTYNMMKTVAEQSKDIVVEVIDSKMLTMGLGFYVIKAVEMLKNKLDFNSLVDEMRGMVDKVHGVYVVKTLEYLKKGGRIGSVSATLGKMLDIKPLISIDEEGKYYTIAKARGRNQSINKLYEVACGMIKDKIVKVALMHSDALNDIMEFAERFKNLKNVVEITIGELGPAMGIYVGTGFIAFLACEV